MTKIPEQFTTLIKDGDQLSERHGEAMARWAMGQASTTTQAPPPANDHTDAIKAFRERFATAETDDEVEAIARDLGRLQKGHPIRKAVGADYKAAKDRCAGVVNPDAEPPPA